MSSKENLQSALDALANALNILGGEKEREAVVKEWFERLHRTSQQATMRNVVLPILKSLDGYYTDRWYDARSAASCEMAHKMLTAVEDDTYLPLI